MHKALGEAFRGWGGFAKQGFNQVRLCSPCKNAIVIRSRMYSYSLVGIIGPPIQGITASLGSQKRRP